mgnify:FL=1
MNFLKPNANIVELITNIIQASQKNMQTINIHSQVIDPFSSIIEASLNELDYENWIRSESSRQKQKTLQNAIGRLHQELLGQIIDVDNLGVGQWVDIVCHNKRIIAEIKTKHNTVKKTDLYSVYDELAAALRNPLYNGYTAYYVEIIPAKPISYDTTFTPVDNNTKQPRQTNEKIRQIDGKSFYALLTGEPNALQQMYEKVKNILSETFNLQEAERFNDLFLRAYDINFFLKNECPSIVKLETTKNIQLIEDQKYSANKQLRWKHGNCNFRATIKQLEKNNFKCPTCKTTL